MRAVHVTVLAALLAPLFAGCIGAPAASDDPVLGSAEGLSEPRFDVLPGESVWIEASSDGAMLHARLFRPDASADPEWKAPAILVMSPYFGYDAREDPLDPASRPTYFRYQWLVDHFVPRGYAVAFEDVRGTGDSGGCLEQTAVLQRQDGYDSVEWFASQEWSNGKVGMFGKSYDAETQQGTAVLAPPHLTTIVPVSSVSGQYEYSFYDGVPYTAQALLSNTFYMATDGVQPPTTTGGLAQYWQRPGCHPLILAQGLDFSGDWNQFWEDREFRKQAGNVTASVLYVHGLQDWNVKPVAIRDWFENIPSTKRAMLGQWAHDYPEENRWNREWSRTDWRATVHKWYDHWLLGIENGILDELPPVQVQDSQGAWRGEATFPPADAAPLTFHFAPGRLVLGDPGEFDAMRLRENEEAFLRSETRLPVPTLDSNGFEERLVFESEPLRRDVRFSGWPTMTLDVTMTDITTARPEADAHFAVILYDVDPDGKATWVNRAYLSTRHRDGVENPQPTPTGEELALALRFFPADTVVPAGHTLRLVVSGSDDWTQPEGSFWGAFVHGGSLTLPVIEREVSRVALDVEFGEPVTS